MSNYYDPVKEKLKQLSPEELYRHGILEKAADDKSYRCPFCGNGSGEGAGDGIKPELIDGVYKFNCFKCNKSGDNIHLLAEFFGLDFKTDCNEVVKLGAEKFGISEDVDAYIPAHDSREQPTKDKNSPEVLKLIADDIQKAPERLPAFIEQCGGIYRGLTLATLQRFKCGYLPDWTHPKTQKYKSQRLIVPTSEKHYNAVAVDRDKVEKKYWKQHAGEKELFNPDALNSDLIIVVEGEIDTMSIYQAGFKNVCATCAATSYDKTLLKEIDERNIQPGTKQFIILFDNDAAGRKNSADFETALREKGFASIVAFIQEGYDANDILMEVGDAGLKIVVEKIVEVSKSELKKTERQLSDGRAREEKISPVPDSELINRLLTGSFGDIYNAERIETVHGHEIRFVTDTGRWYRYDGKIWTDGGKENSAVLPFALDVARKILENVHLIDDEEIRKAVRQKWEKRRTLTDAVGLLKGIDSIRITEKDLNAHKNLLNCQNGVVDLQTGKLYPHDSKLLLTQCVKAEYRSGYRNERVEKIIREILPDEQTRAAYLRFIGYSLTGDIREEKALFIHGRGGNGKGLLSGTLLKLLGDYGCGFPIEGILTQPRIKSADDATPAFAKLHWRRLAVSEEIPAGRKLDYAKFKILTGGDALPVRKLYQDATEISDPVHHMVFSGNHLPELDDAHDPGILRRWLQIRFDQDFNGERCDPSLKEFLQTPDALSGLLSLLIDNAVEWYKNGLIISDKMKAERAEYFSENDFVGEYIRANCIFDLARYISLKEFIDNLKHDNRAETIGLSDRAITSIIEKIPGIKKKRNEEGRRLYGICWTDEKQKNLYNGEQTTIPPF